jgi:hypothetical protein
MPLVLSDFSTTFKRSLHGAFALAFLTSLAVVLWYRGLDPDEFEHLHAAWAVSSGQLPYVDFWDNLGPLLYYLLAPITHWLPEGYLPLFAGRLVCATFSLAALVVVWRIAQRWGGSRAGFVATALLLGSPVFLRKATEIRPDAPMILFIMLAVFALTWNRPKAPPRDLLSGLLEAFSGWRFCFHLKRSFP